MHFRNYSTYTWLCFRQNNSQKPQFIFFNLCLILCMIISFYETQNFGLSEFKNVKNIKVIRFVYYILFIYIMCLNMCLKMNNTESYQQILVNINTLVNLSITYIVNYSKIISILKMYSKFLPSLQFLICQRMIIGFLTHSLPEVTKFKI